MPHRDGKTWRRNFFFRKFRSLPFLFILSNLIYLFSFGSAFQCKLLHTKKQITSPPKKYYSKPSKKRLSLIKKFKTNWKSKKDWFNLFYLKPKQANWVKSSQRGGQEHSIGRQFQDLSTLVQFTVVYFDQRLGARWLKFAFLLEKAKKGQKARNLQQNLAKNWFFKFAPKCWLNVIWE